MFAALISITALQHIDGGIFNLKPMKSSIEYMNRNFNKIIEPVQLMFLNLKDCALEFIEIRDRDRLRVCVSNAFEYTGLGEDTPLNSFEKKFRSTFTTTCNALSRLISQEKKGNGTFALEAVEEAISDEEKSKRLKEIVKYDVACNIISEELTVAEVYETYTGKAKTGSTPGSRL